MCLRPGRAVQSRQDIPHAAVVRGGAGSPARPASSRRVRRDRPVLMGTGTPRAAADGTIPAALASTCADLATATDRDAIGGRQPRFVAAPSSTEEAAALLRAAADLGLTVVPRGSGTHLDWGAPPTSCDLIVDTRRLNRIIEHAAGDLVVSVQAGVKLAELAKVLAQAGQRLALDPLSSGTIGGLIATGAAGPLRYRYGRPRDLLIGITVVRADGAVAKSGGKVVKNVAGYDLGKLFAGSFGTLGLIAEATFRLHPVPAAAGHITLECGTAAAAADAVAAAVESPLQASAVEIDRPAPGAPVRLGVLLEGNPAGVPARVSGMRELLGSGAAASEEAPGWWGHGAAAASDSTLIRIVFWSGALRAVLDGLDSAAAAAGVEPAVG